MYMLMHKYVYGPSARPQTKIFCLFVVQAVHAVLRIFNIATLSEHHPCVLLVEFYILIYTRVLRSSDACLSA